MGKLTLTAPMDISSEEKEMLLNLRKEKARKAWAPKLIHDIDDQVKIAGFNKLYSLVNGFLAEGIRDGRMPSDVEQWCYEAMMELLDEHIFVKLKEMGIVRM